MAGTADVASTPSVAVLGPGRVGGSLARILAQRGALSAVWTRSADKAKSLRAELGTVCSTELSTVLETEPELVLLTVPDRLTQRLSELLAKQNVDRLRGRTVFAHCSGASDESVLEALAEAGFKTGVCHPLFSFGSAHTTATSLAGTLFGIRGSGEAAEVVERLVGGLNGQALHLPEGASAAYHLAATLASNGVFALLAAAERVAGEAGLDTNLLVPALASLASQSATNTAAVGLAAATGPAVRGDASTVSKHLHTLRSLGDTDSAALYAEVTRQLMTVSSAHGLSSELETAAVASVLADEAKGES